MHSNDLINELSTNFIEYSAAVNGDRAIPDARSGLKPVARRILYGAYSGGHTSNKKYVKSARIVGDVMGILHPHGDTAIYEALVRLARDWVMRYPLISFYGNVGNIAGDGAAASRYTEARLAPISEDGLLTGLKKHNVEFVPNYDESTEEPNTLPAIFPNLLCNPNTGIGVALACNWAPHNLNEVAQAIFDYIDGKEPMLPGPDFPTGGIVINSKDIPDILKTGHGSVKIRGKYEIKKQQIIFTEIPYGTTIEGLITEIGKACDAGEILGIEDIHDESTEKIRIVITCEKGVTPESIVQILFNKTNLQSSFSYNMVALVNKTPVEMNLQDCIKVYLEHNEDCLKRECEFDLAKDKERLEVVNGLLKALEDIDNIIKLIKASKNTTDARTNLSEKYGFTEKQSKAIVDMKLGKLASLERIEIENEKAELENNINYLTNLLSSKTEQIKVIRERLSAIVKKYGDARRTQLLDIEVPKDEAPEVIPEDVVVVLTQNGDIKRVPESSFKTQKRNGKGVKTGDGAVLATFATNTVDTLLLFSTKGKMYRLLVDNVPQGTNATKGVNVSSLIKIDYDEKIVAAVSLNKGNPAQYVVFITKNGLIKKTIIDEYFKVKRNTGIQAIKLKEGDSIANVVFMCEEDLILFTKKGISIHIETKDISPIGRVTCGVKGIKLDEGDSVIAGVPLYTKDNLVIVTTSGSAKICELSDFPVQGKGGKGVIAAKTEIAGVVQARKDSNLLVIGEPNSICVSITDLPIVSRSATGNQVIKNSRVTGIAIV